MDTVKEYNDHSPSGGGSGGGDDDGGEKAKEDDEVDVARRRSWLAPPPKQKRLEDGRMHVDGEWGLDEETKGTSDRPVDEALTAKLARFHELKRNHDTHFNQSLARSRAFRNPHIYAKLVEWVDVDETASAYGSMVRRTAIEEEGDDVDVGRTVWSATTAARRSLLAQGGAERIAAEQKRQQEQADEARTHARARGQGRIDFVGSSNALARRPLSSSSSTTSEHHSSRADEAKALAEKRVKLINERSAATRATAEQYVHESSHRRRSGHRDRSARDEERHSHRHH